MEGDGTNADGAEAGGTMEAGAEADGKESDGTEQTGAEAVGVAGVGRGALAGLKSGLVAAAISFATLWTVCPTLAMAVWMGAGDAAVARGCHRSRTASGRGRTGAGGCGVTVLPVGRAPNSDETVVVMAVATRWTVFPRLARPEAMLAESDTGGGETRAGVDGRWYEAADRAPTDPDTAAPAAFCCVAEVVPWRDCCPLPLEGGR